jgi:GNAT superfamily N-acetyltransferase
MRSGIQLDLRPPLELQRMANGELVAIRAADEPGDDALLRELALDLTRTGGRGRVLARLGIIHRVPRSLQPLTHPEALEECLLAVDPRTGTPIGMASISGPGSDDHTAQPWLIVRGSVRRRGVGTALLERLAVRARERGYDRFGLRLVVSEQRMLELMRRVGIACTPSRSLREIEADVPIPGGDGLGVALGAALWAVARGGLEPRLPHG